MRGVGDAHVTVGPPRVSTDVCIGGDDSSNTPVYLHDNYRPQHISIIGKTGYGKTTLLEHLILEDLRSNTSAIVIDPDGDLTRRIISLASKEQRERIALLEVWPDRPFRLNLLDCPDGDIDRTVGGIITLFKRLFNADGTDYAPRLERFLGNALRTLIPSGGTLADVPRLFIDAEFRTKMLTHVRNQSVLTFWRWYEQLKPFDQTIQLESTINRLDSFLSSETARAMVEAAETTVPFDEVLTANGQVLLIRIPTGKLSDKYAKFYGSLFLSLLADRIFARSDIIEPAMRDRLHLYLDEYGWFATSTTAALLQRGRKYGLGTTIAFQTLANLPDEENKQAALQVATFIVFRLTGPDADELVSGFPVIPRREMIEEIVGTRRIKVISQQPVKDLTGGELGHTNPAVISAIHNFIRPLVERARELREQDTRAGFISKPNYEKLDAVLRLIDQLLITAMEHGKQGTQLKAHSIASAMTDIFMTLCGIRGEEQFIHTYLYYKFPGRSTPESRQQKLSAQESIVTVPGFKEAITAHLRQAAQVPNPEAFLSTVTLSEYPWRLLKDEMHRHQLAWRQANRIYKPPIHSYDNRQIIWHELEAKMLADDTAKDDRQLMQAAARLQADAVALISLCRALAVEPVETPTGQEQPETRERLNIQTFGDARTELAGTFATLDPFTAYYQTPKAHGQLRLPAPVKDGYYDEEAIELVRERSRQRYGVPLDPPDDQPPDLPRSPWPGPSTPPPPGRPGPRIGRKPRRDS